MGKIKVTLWMEESAAKALAKLIAKKEPTAKPVVTPGPAKRKTIKAPPEPVVPKLPKLVAVKARPCNGCRGCYFNKDGGLDCKRPSNITDKYPCTGTGIDDTDWVIWKRPKVVTIQDPYGTSFNVTIPVGWRQVKSGVCKKGDKYAGRHGKGMKFFPVLHTLGSSCKSFMLLIRKGK